MQCLWTVSQDEWLESSSYQTQAKTSELKIVIGVLRNPHFHHLIIWGLDIFWGDLKRSSTTPVWVIMHASVDREDLRDSLLRFSGIICVMLLPDNTLSIAAYTLQGTDN